MKKINLTVLSFLCAVLLQAQQQVQFEMIPGSRISYREVANLTRRLDNRYIGLLSTGEQGVLVTNDYGNTYQGTFYINRDLKHDARFVEIPIAETLHIEMTYNISEGFRVKSESARPRLQGFPVFPDKPVSPGERWKAWSVRYVDPLGRNMPTAVRFYCEYQYIGPVNANGQSAEKIKAKYALRYKNEYDNGDPNLQEISYAGHELEIFVYDNTGSMMIIDKIGAGQGQKEVYKFTDGSVLEQSGTIITWINAAIVMDKTKIIRDFLGDFDKDVKKKSPGSDKPEIINLGNEDIEIRQTDEGINLQLKNIHFEPDSAKILASEKKRIDAVADMLKKVPDRTILVVGHTARIGAIETEQKLSEDRAQAIVKELIKRGLSPARFLYEGRGGREPVAGNDTEKGRKQNRRVEITILEN